MRHSAATFAQQLHGSDAPQPGSADVLFCTDMLNLAEFRGLAPEWVARLPAIVYFHENQLTYPVREERERDLHFAVTNITSCLAADLVWFNSEWHRTEFLHALTVLMKRMPDYTHAFPVETLKKKSETQSPGIEVCPCPSGSGRSDQPLKIVWVARWEHDKNPELFFDSLCELHARQVDFRVSILGESFTEIPECFRRARVKLPGRIDWLGFAKTRQEYWKILSGCDVVVSTARHEFFGIAILEAVSAGCFPLVPDNLAYPETLAGNSANVFHDGTVNGIAGRLEELAGDNPGAGKNPVPDISRYAWPVRAAEMDGRLEKMWPD